MRRRELFAAAAGAALMPTLARSAGMSGASVSGDTVPSGSLEIVAEFTGAGPSGIAVIGDRVFVGFPRHADNHSAATLAELKGGRMIAYPDAATSLPSERAQRDRLISIHGMTTDTTGRLWAIDDGKMAGQPIAPGAAKIVGFDPGTDKMIVSIALEPPAMREDSHMNDLRIDLTHGSKGTAYVADSSFGTSPAIVVVDIATGRQRRVLSKHPSINAETGFLAVLEGKPLRYDAHKQTFPVGGVDSVALNADSSRLFFSPLTSRRLYSIETALLSNFDASDETLAEGIRDEGEKVMTDGMASDAADRLYLTAGEHDAIMRREPDGRIEVVVRDPRIVWPDGIFATGTHVYCTLGQWNRLPSFNGGKDLRRPPYLLVRSPISPSNEISSPSRA